MTRVETTTVFLHVSSWGSMGSFVGCDSGLPGPSPRRGLRRTAGDRPADAFDAFDVTGRSSPRTVCVCVCVERPWRNIQLNDLAETCVARTLVWGSPLPEDPWPGSA